MTIRLICSSIYYISNHCNTTNVPGSRYLKSISLTELQQEEWEATSEAWWRCGLNFLCLLQTSVKADCFSHRLDTCAFVANLLHQGKHHQQMLCFAQCCRLLCQWMSTFVSNLGGVEARDSHGVWHVSRLLSKSLCCPQKPSWLNWALFCLALPLVCTEGSAPLDLMAIPCFHRRQEKCGPKLVKKNPIRLVLSLV